MTVKKQNDIKYEHYGVWDRFKNGGGVSLGIITWEGKKNFNVLVELSEKMSQVSCENASSSCNGRNAIIKITEESESPIFVKFVCDNVRCIDMVDIQNVEIQQWA